MHTSMHAGTTTTCESLFMGVPVVTLSGQCHAHNVGRSLLHSMGLAGDWACATREEYVACAVRWAADHGKLAALRATLRDTMLTSALCEHGTFMKVRLPAVFFPFSFLHSVVYVVIVCFRWMAAERVC